MKVRHLLEGLEDPLLVRRAPFMAVVDDALSAAECEALVDRMEALVPAAAPITTMRGFEMRPDIRNNDRVMFDDKELAASLFERLREIVPARMQEEGADVAPVGLNERFRGYRYSPGHRFAPHFDGAYVRDRDERSQLTVLFYLNDGFTGGQTAFGDWEVAVSPRRGQALLFYHPILHEGRVVVSGRKYVLRSDVMYRRTAPTL
jgi:prolyl 4-hydroxylase